MLTVFVSERPFMVHLLTTKRYIVYLTFDRFLSFLLQREMTFYNSILAPLFFLLDSKQIGCKKVKIEKDQSNNCVLQTIIWSFGQPFPPKDPLKTSHSPSAKSDPPISVTSGGVLRTGVNLKNIFGSNIFTRKIFFRFEFQ